MRGGDIGEPLAPAASFDYEAKRWGTASIRPRPWYMNGLKLRYLLEDLAPVHGRVLDVGCGAGQVAKAVKRERPDLAVSACDVSRAAIAAASASPEGVDFRLALAERLPYDDAEFDFVWIFDVLEHVEGPEAVLREVARVLKPGGGFHVVLPLEGQPRTLYRLVGCGTAGQRVGGGHVGGAWRCDRAGDARGQPRGGRDRVGGGPPIARAARRVRPLHVRTDNIG